MSPRPTGRRLRPVVVPLGVVCSATHLLMAPVHGADHPVIGLAVLVIAMFCLYHLGVLWKAPSPARWWSTGVLAAVMTLHVPLLGLASRIGSAATPTVPIHPTHHLVAAGGGPSFETLMAIGTAAGALQTGLCLLVVLTGPRRRPAA